MNGKPDRDEIIRALAEGDDRELAAMDPRMMEHMYGGMADKLIERIWPPRCERCGGHGYVYRTEISKDHCLLAGKPCPAGCPPPMLINSVSDYTISL